MFSVSLSLVFVPPSRTEAVFFMPIVSLPVPPVIVYTPVPIALVSTDKALAKVAALIVVMLDATADKVSVVSSSVPSTFNVTAFALVFVIAIL